MMDTCRSCKLFLDFMKEMIQKQSVTLKVTMEIVGLMKPSEMCMFHIAPAVVGNTNLKKGNTVIKRFSVRLRVFADSAVVLSQRYIKK